MPPIRRSPPCQIAIRSASPSKRRLQKNLETLARERARALGPDISVAIVAVDNASGEIRARVASSDYFDEARAGQVDMSQALRSPGSALKPFIYGVAFEDGLVHPESLIEDRPTRYRQLCAGEFRSDLSRHRHRADALQMSLNVPAVALLDKVGASRLTTRLAQAGGPLALPKGEVPGLAMGLGGVGVKLHRPDHALLRDRAARHDHSAH